jgi:tRNA guanosine-2'-O-methyltransferase
MRVVKSDVFQGIAVSSDAWLDMAEVREGNLIDCIRAYKRQGYTILGLEQTDTSVHYFHLHILYRRNDCKSLLYL